MTVNEISITEGNLSELHNVYQRLQMDFPANELKDYKHFQKLLANEKYKLIWARQQEKIIGYALIYEFEHLPAIWLDYMAIDQQFRNAGYGSLFFHKITQSKRDGYVGTFVEVEIPEEDSDSREQQIRRINFYERMGARRLNISYKLPTNDGGLPLYLYFRPSPHIHRLPKEQILAGIEEVFQFIHSDVIDKDTILNEISPSIEEEYFN